MKTQFRNYLVGLVPLLLFVGLVFGVIWRFAYAPGCLLTASEHGDARKIAFLTHLGVHPDSEIWLNGGLMQCAAANGQTQAMATLLGLGANVNRLDGYGVTPAQAAVFGHQVESLRWLLAHGADPRIKSRDGYALAEYVTNHVAEPEREKFLTVIRAASNQKDGTNATLPFSPKTNWAPGAAASHRSP